jgi:hypothetical protein
MKDNKQQFDFSDYKPDHFCYDVTNKKVIGKMKDETNGDPISEFVGLRPKMYSQLTYHSGEYEAKKRAKGIKKSVVEKNVTHEMFKKSLLDSEVILSKMTTFRSYKHEMYTIDVNKVGLCPYDDKRCLMKDGINTVALGHFQYSPKNVFTVIRDYLN